MYTHKVVEWAAKEVERQKATPIFVPYMLSGWQFARQMTELTEHNIQIINTLVIRGRCRYKGGIGISASIPDTSYIPDLIGYRTTPVTFDNGNQGLRGQQIDRAMGNLLEALLNIDEWVHEFLKIHPFHDGNGRTAAILWNWMNVSLDDPLSLPEYSFI